MKEEAKPDLTEEEKFAKEAERLVCENDRIAVACLRAVMGWDAYLMHRTQCAACKPVECPEGKAIRIQAVNIQKETMSTLRLTMRGVVQ